jgi:1-acyl-sn-glycerol-3-phosphate acyltransferase
MVKLQPARSGIGLTVIKSTAPVVPVRVFGTFEAYGKDAKIPKPYKIMAKYGRPMLFTELRAEAKVCSKPRLKEIYQEVADQIMAQIAKLEPCEDKETFP